MAESNQDNMDNFFDFGGISLPESPQCEMGDDSFLTEFAIKSVRNVVCDMHPEGGCYCDTIINDFGLNEEPVSIAEPESYANFAAWIPRYSKPGEGCHNCRFKGLECWFTYEGQTTCSPCSALFRECSFCAKEARPRGTMDTLHVVEEDVTKEQGAFTGIVALKSYDRSALEPQDDDRTCRKTGTRFPRAAIKILKDWMEQHREHPYPTEEEKEELKARTGLKSAQISNWLANTRRRTKTRSRGLSPSIRTPTWSTSASTTPAIDIPFDKKNITHNGKTWDIMNPLERWQHSPPENEPASVTAIVQAVATTTVDSQDSSLSSVHGIRQLDSSAGSGSFQIRRAPSVSSFETGLSDSLVSSGSLSNLSLGSSMSHASRNSSLESRGKDRRRRRRTAANPSRNLKVQELRPFQCTFCTDRFRTKYDWSRHEKSLHLSLEKWICAPLGPVAVLPTGQRQCVYCNETNPSNDHIESHNHRACEEKGLDARTFYRKDHLRQHLRLVHGCKMLEGMDTWKSEATYIKSRCGFCQMYFDKWQDRIDHLAKHFRSGAQMKDWKGCRGLDPAVAANVTNAMPPYLIGNESLSPFPFSASNEATWNQNQRFMTAGTDLEYTLPTSPDWDSLIGPMSTTMANEGCPATASNNIQHSLDYTPTRALTSSEMLQQSFEQSPSGGQNKGSPGAITCWEILTVSLGQYVQANIQQGIFPTDEDLQRHARLILYEDDDSWNTTAADNQEWLELFKKAHGLPSIATDVRVDLDEDLGVGTRLAELDFDQFVGDGAWDSFTNNTTMAGV